MKPQPLTQGIVCALWTPLTRDGNLDQATLDENLEWLSSTGIDGYLALGSTGRFPLLPSTVRQQFAEHTLSRVKDQPVLINASHLDSRKAALLSQHAAAQGAAGVTMMTPWYYEQAQADLVAWFATAGNATSLPLWLYNFPERTGNRIQLGTVKELLDHMPIGGFKQSGADQGMIRDLAVLAKTRPFPIFAGADARIPESLELGAAGCIGGMANALPEAMVALYRACGDDQPESAAPHLELLRAVSQRMHLVPFPYNVAAVMAARGLKYGELPDTMSRVTLAHFEQLKSEVNGLLLAYGVTMCA